MRLAEAALFGSAMGPIHCILAARRASSARESQNKLENIAAQVLVLGNFGKLLGHVRPIDLDVFLFQLPSFERDLIEYALEYRMQAAGPEFFGLLGYPYRQSVQARNWLVA